MFFHFLSCSFIFCHFLSLFFPFFFISSCSSFFLGAQNSFFMPRLPHDFLLKLLCKNFFWAVSGGTPLGRFFSRLCFFFIFVFFFNFFPMLFLFFICFSFLQFFFLYFPFVLLKKIFSSFFMLFLFFLFSGAQNLWLHFKIPWRKGHILSWVYLLCIGSSSLFTVE